MKRLTTEWIAKAEEDHLAAIELASSLKLTPYNVICFHCQQAGEKWLKSRLCEDGIHFPVTGHFKVYHPRSNQNVPPRDVCVLGLAGRFLQGL